MTEALERADKLKGNFPRITWNKILAQAKQNPIQIRDTYKIIMYKDEPYYIVRWMDFAGVKNINSQMPKILQSKFLSVDTKKEISDRWRKVSPKNYEKFLQSVK